MIQMLVPMVGNGKSTDAVGSPFPKPLIEISGVPMIELVVSNLTPSEDHRFIFICKEEHIKGFALGEVLSLITVDPIIVLSKPTSGALCSTLAAIDHIDPDAELIIAAADQYVDIDIQSFIAEARKGSWDGYMITFPSTHPKWSYARVENDHVVEVAEKRPISRLASAGIYYYKKASDYIEAAQRVILKNASVVGEFYICPVYNEYILSGKRVGVHEVSRKQMQSFDSLDNIDMFPVRHPELFDF